MARDPRIEKLIELGGSEGGIARAQAIAKQHLTGFPHNGCAENLSALLRLAEIDVPMTAGAGALAQILKARGWQTHSVGSQQPGDVGVTINANSIPGPDHIYLVVRPIDHDEMVIADNQSKQPHTRFASGHGGTTRTAFFLRAPV